MEQKSSHKKSKFKLNKKLLRNIAIVVVVFVGGMAVGQSDSRFVNNLFGEKSVQKQDLPNKLDYSGVEEVYDQLKASFDGQLDVKKLEDGLKQGLVGAAGDPYTEYLNVEATKEFDEGLNGSFEGIGAELGKDGQSIVIVSPIAGFPAEKAGLKPKDIVAEINGESAYNLNITEAVRKSAGLKAPTLN